MAGIDAALADVNAALAPQTGASAAAAPSAPPAAAAPQSGVDAALADIAKSPEQLRAELGTPQKAGGVVRNVAAGANDTAASIVGGPVDAATWLVNKIASPFTGIADTEFGEPTKLSVPPTMKDVQQPAPPRPLISNPIGGSQSIESAMGLVGADPRNVGVDNAYDAAARGAGSGAVSMAAPYMAGRALIAGGFGDNTTFAGALARATGGSAAPDAGIVRTAAGAAGNAAIGAGASLGGEGAEALVPPDSPYRPLANFAGQMVAGGALAGGMGAGRAAANYSADLARDLLGPLSPAYREAAVGQTLRDATNELPAATAALNRPSQLVPGSAPTTAQLAGDPGLAGLEAAQRTANPAPFAARDADQVAARATALQNVAPQGNPGAVRDLLQQQLLSIDAAGDAAVQAAQQRAQQAYAAAGGQQSAQDIGAAMRDQLEAAKASTKAQERTLWRAIDPDGSLTINGSPVKQAANQIAAEVPNTARPMEGEEAGIFRAAQFLGTASPFTQYTALRSRVLDAIRTEAATNGQSQSWRRLSMLRGAMDANLENAAQGIAQQQAQDVATGALSPDMTLGANLIRAQRAWYADRSANAAQPGAPSGGAGAVGYAGGGSPAIPGVAGTAGPAGVGPLRNPGVPGIPSSTPAVAPTPFDAAAAARYRTAASATRARAQTFNNAQVGPALQERGGTYRLSDSQVPDRFISSPEGAQAFLAAGGDRPTLEGAFVSDLRRAATKPDGTLDPLRYQTWLRRRGPALADFPQLRGLLGDAARAQEAVDTVTAHARDQSLQYQRSAARHFLNAEPAQAVQSALSGKNPIEDMRALSRVVGNDPDAKTGLQRAVADYMAQRLIRNPNEEGIGPMSATAVNDFLRRHVALREVFSPEQMAALNSIAKDLQRAKTAAIGGGARPVVAQQAANAGTGSLLTHYLGHGLAGLAGYLMGGVHGAIESTGGFTMAKSALDAINRAGITKTDQLLTEALLNPELAKTLMTKASPGNRPFIAQRLASQLGTLAGVGAVSAVSPQRRSEVPMLRPSGGPLVAPMLPATPRLVPGSSLHLH